jgi:hypothetical protein
MPQLKRHRVVMLTDAKVKSLRPDPTGESLEVILLCEGSTCGFARSKPRYMYSSAAGLAGPSRPELRSVASMVHPSPTIVSGPRRTI